MTTREQYNAAYRLIRASSNLQPRDDDPEFTVYPSRIVESALRSRRLLVWWPESERQNERSHWLSCLKSDHRVYGTSYGHWVLKANLKSWSGFFRQWIENHPELA